LDGLSFINLVGNEDGFNCGEVGDLSVAAKAEVGEVVVSDVGGDGLVGEFAVGGLGEGTVGGLVDDLDLGDVGVVGS
jgi:hypothetical protein